MKAKQTSSSIKKPLLIMGIAFIALGCTLGASSFAWFLLPSSTKQVNGMDGEATGSYFSPVNEDGKADGTKDHPYGIKNAKQLYYFNWLQDLGYFNKDANEDNVIDQQCYFVLMNDIDASNYVLPPAGTKDYPFVGNFDGAGYKISNLKISNSWDDLTNIPKGAQQDSTETMLSNAEIVGFFGIIGQYSSDASSTADSVTTGSVNCKGKDGNVTEAAYTIRSVSGTGDEAVTTYVNAVSNLYFDNLNVSTVADKTLAGLLAGYVNGQMQYCGVRSGYFSFGTDVGVLTDDVLGTTNTKLSKYSIVGDYNSNNFSWDGKPTNETGGNDWGGSIDFFNLAKRVSYMVADDFSYASYSYSSTPDKFNVKNVQYMKFQVTRKNGSSSSASWVPFYKAYTTGTYLAGGTYLPLNVDLDTEFPKDADGNYTGITSSTKTIGRNSIPYETNAFFTSNTEEKLSTNESKAIINSGYITTNSGTSNKDGTFLVSNYHYYAANSYGENPSSNDYSIYNYSEDTFVPLYYDYNSKAMKQIKVGSNTTNNTIFNSLSAIDEKELHQYTSVKAKLSSFLNSESGLLHGIKWQTNSVGTINVEGTLNINGDAGYKTLLSPGIDFVLKEDGFITCLYLSEITQSSNSLFNLYKVTRAGNKSSGAPSYSQLTSVSDSNGKVCYTSDSIPTNKYKAVFYVEIPVEAGEYFISGGSSDNSVSSSILYLDIGANAGDSGGSSVTEVAPSIDFVYYSDPANKVIKKIDSTNSDGEADYIPSKLTCAIAGKPTTIYFYRVLSSDGTTESTILYYVNTAGDSAATLVWTGTGTSAEGSYNDYGQSEDTTSGGAN